MEMVLSVTVCVLSILVVVLLGWQIYSTITIEKRLKQMIKDSEGKLSEAFNYKMSKIGGELRFNSGQDSFNKKQYYPAFCMCLESLNLFSAAKDSGGIVMSQWFIYQSIQMGDLKLSEDDKMKLKESLRVCYTDSLFTDYKDKILELII